MGVLQKEFDRVFEELCTTDSLRVMLVRRVAEARELSLTEEQIQTLAKSINGDSGHDEVEVQLDGFSEDIRITSEDLEAALKTLEEDMEGRAEKSVLAALDELPPGVLKSLYDDLPEALRHRRGLECQFRDRHFGRWKEGLDRLEMLIMIAQESGSTYIEDLNEGGIEEIGEEMSADDSGMLKALIGLHARACRIASEALCLLQGGYADGANARWRSLHEVAVTALFLTQHAGNIADRYMDHAAVECLNAAEQYQKHCHTLGYDPYTVEEMNEIRAEADAVIQKYGPDFKRDYGWASHALGTADATFTKVEAALDMAHWRPFFKMACHSVHAGSQALSFCMSVPTEAHGMLLTGPSNAGLADPGHSTAISLTLASVALLTFRPNLDSLVTCKCMQQLCDDIGEAFLAAHEGLEGEMNSDPPA
ncbi:MAG TPA: DUF5677 domain-containing protein [Pirellulaceae bacterium]|nr:DUF5677 domain-containing protein [Pirellulaceae bacterium]